MIVHSQWEEEAGTLFWRLQVLYVFQVTKPSDSRLEAFPSCYFFLIFSCLQSGSWLIGFCLKRCFQCTEPTGVGVTLICEFCVGRTAKSLAVYQWLAAEQLHLDVEFIWDLCQAAPSIMAHHLFPPSFFYFLTSTAFQRLRLFWVVICCCFVFLHPVYFWLALEMVTILHHVHVPLVMKNTMSSQWSLWGSLGALKQTSWGCFVDGNSLCGQICPLCHGNCTGSPSLIGSFVKEHCDSVYSTAVCVRACYA